MEQRFEVASLLESGMIYNEILERTGASSATISRGEPFPQLRHRRLCEDLRPDAGGEGGSMSAYGALAGAYDALLADGDYLRRGKAIAKALKKSPIPVRHVLDLGCGTGTIACYLAAEGYRVTATDLSEEMLTEAAGKAMGLEAPPFFLCQSMPKLRLTEPVDAVVSTLDSLNYLTRPSDLRETFRRVGRYLRPGGLFLFDVNTPYKLRRMDRQMYMDETDESYCVWQTFFSEKTHVCTYQVDLFRLRRDGAWDRDYEEHRERAWTEEELRRFLTEAGFTDIRLTGDLTHRPPKAEEDRWNLCCRRAAE